MTTSTANATAPTTSPPPGAPTEREARPSLVDESARAVQGYFGRLGRIGVELAYVLLPIEQLRLAASRLPIEMTTMFHIAPPVSGVTAADSVFEATEAARMEAPGVSPTLLIEADGDRPGFGVFVVENLSGKPVSAQIGVSSFIGEQGHEVRPRLMLRPSSVSLGPGEQAIVKLAAELDEALEVGVRYRGVIAIPALSNRRIPVVLRRRPAGSAPEATAVATPVRRDPPAGAAAVGPGGATAARGAIAAKPRRANRAKPPRANAAKAPRTNPVKPGAELPAPPPATPRRRRTTSSPDEPR